MIVNKKAVFPHINNYQLRAATVEIDEKMAGQTLQIVVTAAMNDAINKAQKSGGKAKIEHVKLALRGNFADGKALNPDDAKLLKAVGSIVAKYKELELTEDGFLQVKGAPKMVDADIKGSAKVEPKQPKEDAAKAAQIKAQQDEIEALKAALEAANAAKEEAPAEPKEAKKSSKKADKETSKEEWSSTESGAA